MTPPAPAEHQALLSRWLESLAGLPAVEAVWLEGSMGRGQANLASDIDLRIALADTAYIELWETDRGPLLRGLGEYLLLENTFVRALTSEGIIIELWAYRTSELPTLELYEWTTLLWRVPADTPALRRLPLRTPAETWPDERPLTVEDVRKLTNLFLMLLAESPAPLGNRELHSARFQLDDVRTELVKMPSVLVSSETGRRQSLVCEGEENNHDDETIQ